MPKALVKKLLLIFLGVMLLVISSTPGFAAPSKSWQEIKAVFIVRYLNYLTWPSVADPKKKGAVTICVHQGDLLAAYLPGAAKSEGILYPLKVREVNKRDDFSPCHILFISQGYDDIVPYVHEVTQGKPIVTMSDIRGFVKNGGLTGFYVKSQTTDVILEINMKTMVNHGVVFDPDFVNIMQIYRD